MEHPNLWTAETPYLYTLRTTLTQKGKTLQTFEHKFGFRELTIDGNILKLNGQPIKLRGVTSHSTDPKTVKVIDEASILHDMKLMKEASINYIRTSHYPKEPLFYELADSLGFYIIDEVPFGYGDKNLSDSTFYPVLQQRAQATIRRDKNEIYFDSLGEIIPCYKLSSGEKQMLIILLSVLVQNHRPYVLFMDEPEVSLHIEWQQRLVGLVRDLNPKAQIILTTHSPAVIMDGWADCVTDVEDIVS